MATKINIAQLDIDIDGLKSSMVEAKRELDRLVESNKEMRKAGDSANETYIEQDAAIKRLRAEYNSQARVLNQAIVAIEGADKAYNSQIKTVAQAEAANKTLRQAVKHLDTTTLEGIETAEKYNARIEENTAFMKDNVDEQIQGYMSVGEYSKGIQDAAKELSPFNMLLKGMTGGFKEAGGVLPFVTQSLKGVVGGIRAATVSSLAFIATPVGAVIAAIGLALGLVINYLKNTESGMDKVRSVLTPLNEILKVFWELLENAGKALVSAFTNPVDSIKTVGNLIGKVLVGYVKTAMRYFTNLGKIMLGAVTFDRSMIKEGWDDMKALAEETKDTIVDGFNKAKAAIDEFGNAILDAADNGSELERLKIAIRESTEELAASENDYKDALLEQEAIYKDRSKSEKERLDAAEAMKKLQEERSAQIQNQLSMEIERYRREISAGETTHEQRMKLIELEKRLGDEKRKVGEFEVQQLSRINNIHERGERDRQRALQEQKKLQEDILRLEEARARLQKSQSALTDYLLARDLEYAKKIAEDESLSFEVRKESQEFWEHHSLRLLDLEKEHNKVRLEELEILQSIDEARLKSSEAGAKEVAREISSVKKLLDIAKSFREDTEFDESRFFNSATRAIGDLETIYGEAAEGILNVSEEEFIDNFEDIFKKLEDIPLDDYWDTEETRENLRHMKEEWASSLHELKSSADESGTSIVDFLSTISDSSEKASEDLAKLESSYEDLIRQSEESTDNLAKINLERVEILSKEDTLLDEMYDLRYKLFNQEEEEARLLEEAKRAMREETTLLQQETELERLVYERELRAQEMENELDEEEAFLKEKIALLGLSEEEKTEILVKHAILRRERMAALEDEWREEDKQLTEDYEAYKRDMSRETTDLILDQMGRESAAVKIFSAIRKGMALQEWIVQKKKAASDMELAKASATGELAKGQAKTAASAPFPANIPLILGFVAQAAGILAMFKKPKVKDPKFARGTILGGSRHFEGGIKTPFGEVEGGEMLLTRGVTFDPILRSMASQLNMMGGGDRLDTGSSVGSIRSPKGFIDYDTLAAKVAQANRHLPSPLVRVSDIDRVQDSVKVIDDMTTF